MNAEATPRWGHSVAAMGVISAVGVAVIYIPQPIQTLVAHEFRVPIESSGAAVVAVQAGYALGVLLLVSLGDRIAARRQVSFQLIATAAAILASALAPSFPFFVVASFLAGAAATVGQILVSAALRISPAQSRGRTAAVLLGSIIIGLFAVRTVLGTLAEQLGWRWVLLGCALLLLACVPLCLRYAPGAAPENPPRYRAIMTSIPRIAASSPVLRVMAATHVLAFGAFITAWSTITVFAVARLGLSVSAASLIGIAGLVGGIATIVTARLHPVLGVRVALPVSLTLLLAGAGGLAAFPQLLPVDLAALFLISFGMSSSQVSTQARALAAVAPEMSGRANTVFMASTFLGGAAATAIAEAVFRWGGYAMVGVMATVLALGALTLAGTAMKRGMV